MSTGRDDNVLGANKLTVDLDSVCIYKAGTAFNQLDTIPLEATIVGRTCSVNISFAIFPKGSKIKSVIIRGKAVIWPIMMDSFSDLSSVPHNLLWDTADIDTGATQFLFFNNGNLGTVFACPIHGSNSPAATANSNHIKFFHLVRISFYYMR